MESISKYNIHGVEYVKLDELNELIRQMKRKASEGEEPGYICDDENERIAAMLALNHLGAVLNKEKIEAKRIERLEAAAKTGEKPGRYMVYKGGDGPREYWYFIEWRNAKPIIGMTDGAVFTYERMARGVAEQLGAEWKVVDVSPEACYDAERLMAAMFREDEEDSDGDCDE